MGGIAVLHYFIKEFSLRCFLVASVNVFVGRGVFAISFAELRESCARFALDML